MSLAANGAHPVRPLGLGRVWERFLSGGVAGFVVIASYEEVGLYEVYECACLRREIFPLSHDHAVTALRKESTHVVDGEFGVIGFVDTDAGNDGNAQTHGDVLLDHFPAADFYGDAVGNLRLLENEVDHAVRRESLRRKDQSVGRKVL
jgi:hypothetical protein